jgi:hypothetical protein
MSSRSRLDRERQGGIAWHHEEERVMSYRSYEHPRNAIAIVRAYLEGDLPEAAKVARERGVSVDDPKLLRETLLYLVGQTTLFIETIASSRGCTAIDIVDQWQVESEAQLPRGANADEPQ